MNMMVFNSMAAQDDDVQHFTPQGVCAKDIAFTVRDGKVHNVRFTGGCPGNLQGIAALIEGMPVTEVAAKLKGITCGRKSTSCPDQLVQALEEAQV